MMFPFSIGIAIDAGTSPDPPGASRFVVEPVGHQWQS
jgi:hypothetical protein